jgi:hypothetical protein
VYPWYYTLYYKILPTKRYIVKVQPAPGLGTTLIACKTYIALVVTVHPSGLAVIDEDRPGFPATHNPVELKMIRWTQKTLNGAFRDDFYP